MPRIKIFHNISRDASFGLNVAFTRDGREQSVKDYESRSHSLVWVFEYELDRTHEFRDQEMLNEAFEIFNVGTGSLAQQYRARRLRSLSVGDVVLIDAAAYACESAGWKPVSWHDLRILTAGDADKEIRERYQIKVGEALSITVPLAD